MSTANANRCAELSRRLILQAGYELEEKGDRVQASEKASGALAQAVKAFAEDRQWRHSSHNLRREILRMIGAEFGRPSLRLAQRAADDLHVNFYEDMMDDEEVAEYLAEIKDSLDFLWEARSRGVNPGFTPSPAQQRVIDRLRLTEEEVSADPSVDFPPPMPPLAPPQI